MYRRNAMSVSLYAHRNLAGGNSASDTQAPILLRQRKDSVGRHDWCVVDGKIFHFMLDDLSSFRFEAVHADTVHVQGLAHGHFGNQYGMPRDADRGPGKVIDQTVLEAVSFRLEPKVDKLLEELDGTLVVLDSRQLNTRGVDSSYFVVVNAVICKK